MLKSSLTLIIIFLLNISVLIAENAIDGQIYVSGIGGVKSINSTTVAVTSSIDVSSSLFTGITVDLENIWAVDNSNNFLYKIDKETFAVVNKFATGSSPFAVAVDENFAWVTNQGDHTVGKYNKSTMGL